MKHFSLSEFASPDTGEAYMDPQFLVRLDAARAKAGIPFVINSGYRTPEHNASVGGSPTSSHVKGLAVDIKADNSRDRAIILEALMGSGFNRIGIASTFIHVDMDPSKSPEVVWLYE